MLLYLSYSNNKKKIVIKMKKNIIIKNRNKSQFYVEALSLILRTSYRVMYANNVTNLQ